MLRRLVVASSLMIVPMQVIQAQSLAAVAKSEEERRAMAPKASKVVTDSDLKKEEAPLPKAGAPPAPATLGPIEMSTTTKWEPRVSKSELDDTPLVVISLDANAPVQAWLKVVRPSLVLRCKERVLDTFVRTETAASVESGAIHSHSVRLRFDSAPAQEQDWGEATDRKGLFAPEPELFLDQLRRTSRLLFEFTPFNAPPVVAAFDTRGLELHIAKILNACLEKTKIRGRLAAPSAWASAR